MSSRIHRIDNAALDECAHEYSLCRFVHLPNSGYSGKMLSMGPLDLLCLWVVSDLECARGPIFLQVTPFHGLMGSYQDHYYRTN
jgi:hypothetical protein